jgi:gliding motility-associated-like protein
VSSNELHLSGRAQLCPRQSALLTATATGSPVTRYLWSTGATTPTLLVRQAGSYQLTITLADGCQLTASHTIGPPRAQVASVSGDTLLCPGSTLTLTALNPDALTYQWTTGATSPTIPVTQPGLYGVVLTYAGGCSSRDSLQVYAAPLASGFTLGSDTTLCVEGSLLLHAPSGSGPGVNWRWSDGSTGPTLQVTSAGTYALTLTTPCSSRTLSRTVAYASCLFIPNVVTPNNDQRNDRFVIQGLLRGDWALTLYNRWGRQVYAVPVYHQDWGGDAEAGLYYYLLRHASTATTYKGWLEVIR